MLHAVHEGAGERVVLVHGFTQTLASMAPLAERLTATHEVVRVDLPGHGGSGWVRATLPQAAALLGAAGGAAPYVGYSMGGRIALHLALAQPGTVRALVLVGTHPGIDDAAERAARRREDGERADAMERDGLEQFLDAWLAQPLFASLPEHAAGRRDRLANRAPDLAAALRLLGTGTQEPLWDRLHTLPMPVLLVAGGEDTRYAALAERARAAIGTNAQVQLVPGAGHAAHLERPEATADAVGAFLAHHAAP